MSGGWEMGVGIQLLTLWQDTLGAWTTASQTPPVGFGSGAHSGSHALCMSPFRPLAHPPVLPVLLSKQWKLLSRCIMLHS